jgi:hypothetical protein
MNHDDDAILRVMKGPFKIRSIFDGGRHVGTLVVKPNQAHAFDQHERALGTFKGETEAREVVTAHARQRGSYGKPRTSQ